MFFSLQSTEEGEEACVGGRVHQKLLNLAIKLTEYMFVIINSQSYNCT